jgi:hypothetical protein
MKLVRQKLDAPRVADVAAAVRSELGRLGLERTIRPGDTVALTAGSRGIADLVPILRETIRYLRDAGAAPFIVPAMGSHGGGVAEGQVAVLKGYGVTPENVGAPIRASMEVVEVGRHSMGGPIFLDRIASEADHIGVVARVKPHTGFSGAFESGLIKMMMVGLGKHEGAKEYHRVLLRTSWEPFARATAETLLRVAPIRFGLAVVENARDESARIEAVAPEKFLAREPELLSLARRLAPRLPFAEADLLIIDRIGKDVSGSGADANVIGRKPLGDWNDRSGPRAGPRILRIFVRDLSDATRGNAAGIGLADFTTDRLVAKMDYRATVVNCITANHPLAAAIPVHFPSDREAIETALGTIGLSDPSGAKVLWIRDTLRTEILAVSDACDAMQADPALEHLGPLDWRFDDLGNLMEWSGGEQGPDDDPSGAS